VTGETHAHDPHDESIGTNADSTHDDVLEARTTR